MTIRTSPQKGCGLIGFDLFAGCSRKILGNRGISRYPSRHHIVVEGVIECVTRQTNDWLHRPEQILGHRTMRAMAGPTVFRNGRVFINPWAHVILVTGRTDLIARAMSHTLVFVWIVATHAGHSSFAHGMMRRIIELSVNRPVTLYAQA